MAGNRLNRPDEAERKRPALSEADMQARWLRAGIYRAPQEDERLYRVSVAELVLLQVERINKAGRPIGTGEPITAAVDGEEAIWPTDPVLRRVIRRAIAGLYAVGIDIGEADVALHVDGRVSMRAVRRLRNQLYPATRPVPEAASLLIGADPEFVLIKPDGKVAHASRYLGGPRGAAGSDSMLIRRRLMYPIAELRPDPAADPAALAAGIRRLLLRAAGLVRDKGLRWAAGAMPVPGLALGGHIHLSGVRLTPRLLRLLDSYAAFPLALVEDPAGRGRRPRYGVLGDYRQQPHGGFEYRTLPSWLVSPAAAKAAFALALLCACEADALAYIPALDERYVAAYYAGDRAELAGCLDRVAASMAATESYAALAPYIEPLLDAARRGATWDERADIRVKWRIPRE
ncbi:putative amidoligase domain-containing protein [Paenibacillus glycanilyticus]|uniref:PhiEco32-like amidoligase-type 2 protein n=1 Tax=Paenibacillus glycanilyticus TaxID=126569 RepID=A0ABQ6GB11_9BACL|nr:hypothetical protein [Paenibacillus glycanilyticus]GLX68149.1 hypothetical protein MU1_24940 [Paenibacillus glycanilyticus]